MHVSTHLQVSVADPNTPPHTRIDRRVSRSSSFNTCQTEIEEDRRTLTYTCIRAHKPPVTRLSFLRVLQAIERAAEEAARGGAFSSLSPGAGHFPRVGDEPDDDQETRRRRRGRTEGGGSCGESEAAGLYAIVGLRQELDIQCMRVLNHFSDAK